jgi:hypothetical protein
MKFDSDKLPWAPVLIKFDSDPGLPRFTSFAGPGFAGPSFAKRSYHISISPFRPVHEDRKVRIVLRDKGLVRWNGGRANHL